MTVALYTMHGWYSAIAVIGMIHKLRTFPDPKLQLKIIAQAAPDNSTPTIPFAVLHTFRQVYGTNAPP